MWNNFGRILAGYFLQVQANCSRKCEKTLIRKLKTKMKTLKCSNSLGVPNSDNHEQDMYIIKIEFQQFLSQNL